MINVARVKAKVRKDQELNLSELAIVTARDRGELARMMLPLQNGKISHSDYKRIIRKRQDSAERKLKLRVVRTSVSSRPVNVGRREAIADKFDAPSPKRAGRVASHPAREFQLRNTA